MTICVIFLGILATPVVVQPQLLNPGKPLRGDWTKKLDDRDLFLRWLIDGCADGQPCSRRSDSSYRVERGGLDGFYNNPYRPELGSIDTPMLRRTPAAYADGVFKPNGESRPNPLELSEKLMKGRNGTTSKTGKTALLVFFGQQLVEEVLDAQKPACPPEYFNIQIPVNHTYREMTNLEELPFLRTRYESTSGIGPNNPRQQLNEVTPYLDGNLVYGTSATWTDLLRHFGNGSLAPRGQLAWSDPQQRFPEKNTVNLPMFNPPPPTLHAEFAQKHETLKASRFFMLGNPRGNENPMLLSLGVLWFRWHNAIARYLGKSRPHWSDDRVFHETKKWVIATYQHLAVNVWLPEWIGEPLPPYEGYDPTGTPQIDHLFQTAAMRFGHTLVTPGVYLRDYGVNGCGPIPFTIVREQLGASSNGHGAGVRTCNSFWRPQDILLAKGPQSNRGFNSDIIDIDRILMGMSSQLAEREDNIIVQDLREFVFGPMEFPRRDLMALNIQRGRDHGIPDYNTAREVMGLKRIESFQSFIKDTNTTVHLHDEEVIVRFAKLYNHDINNVDLWVGGLLETSFGPGQLFKAILKDQFQRIRDTDRFWYKNQNNGLFTRAEVGRLEQLSLYDVIMSVTQMSALDIQQNPFLSPSTDLPGQDLDPVCKDKLNQITACRRLGPLNENKTEQEFNCFALSQLGTEATPLESCTPASSYTYFQGSEWSYGSSVVLLIVVMIVILGVAVLLLRRRNVREFRRRKAYSQKQLQRSLRLAKVPKNQVRSITVVEWISRREERIVSLVFYSRGKKIEVRSESALLLRTIDLSRDQPFQLSHASNAMTICLKLPSEYDLVMKFDNDTKVDQFLNIWNSFIRETGLRPEPNPTPFIPETQILAQAVTCEHRRKRLQMFLRSAFAHAFNICQDENETMMAPDAFLMELTREEFAMELRMTPDSQFVEKIFQLVDKDNNGYVSFREFRDLLVVFTKDDADEKFQFLFSMYDTQKAGKLTIQDFYTMIKSLVQLSNSAIKEEEINSTAECMLSSDEITFDEFKTVFKSHRKTIASMELGFVGPDVPKQFQSRPGEKTPIHQMKVAKAEDTSRMEEDDPRRVSFKRHPRKREMSAGMFPTLTQTTPSPFHQILRRLDRWRLELFWVTLFTLILLGVFTERAYTYAVEREHIGLRRATGAGVPITRGAASGMMLCFSVLLLAPCRHVTTWLRETPVVRYVPLDSAIAFHQYVGMWGIFFAVVHTIGHLFNFYNIATQPAQDLACLFREHFFPTHVLPKFHHWLWATMTGITGVLLVIQTLIILVFSVPFMRRRLYVAFWWTHKSYPVFYILILLHGAARLVQEPHFPYFLAGPAVLFVLDHLISVRRRRVMVSVINAQLLPSDVTKLEIARPPDFEFRSGQWVRILCPSLGDPVFHAFTISSAPQSQTLSLHVRAVGPWTQRLRQTVEESINQARPYPQLYLDGPYGEGHQDWCRYEVSVLIGAGIGVTPFASILQDINLRISTNGAQKLPSKKIYFLWVTRDQKQFEWMVDLLRQVESNDSSELITTHIFITQFFQKFDIRTIMLYVCERHFQRVSQRSLFTGLRAVTHFGHPNFEATLHCLKELHPEVQKFGVFSCGPRSLTQSIDSACQHVNGHGSVDFRHYFENY